MNPQDPYNGLNPSAQPTPGQIPPQQPTPAPNPYPSQQTVQNGQNPYQAPQQPIQPAQNPYPPQQQTMQPGPPQYGGQQPYASPPNKSSKNKILIAVVAAFLLIAGASATFFLTNKDDSASSDTSIAGEGASSQTVKAKKNVPDSKDYDTTSANIETDCFSYKVVEGTKTTVSPCSTLSFYHSADRKNNGEFRVNHTISADTKGAQKLTNSVIKSYTDNIANNPVISKTISKGKKTTVDGLPAYEFIATENDSVGFIWKFVIVETGNKFAIYNEVAPFFEISGEYDNADGNTATFFDNALDSFKWK